MKKICLLSSIYMVIFIAFTGCAQKSVTENNFTKWVNDWTTIYGDDVTINQ